MLRLLPPRSRGASITVAANLALGYGRWTRCTDPEIETTGVLIDAIARVANRKGTEFEVDARFSFATTAVLSQVPSPVFCCYGAGLVNPDGVVTLIRASLASPADQPSVEYLHYRWTFSLLRS